MDYNEIVEMIHKLVVEEARQDINDEYKNAIVVAIDALTHLRKYH